MSNFSFRRGKDLRFCNPFGVYLWNFRKASGLSRFHAAGTNKPHAKDAKDAKGRGLFSSQYESLNGEPNDRCEKSFFCLPLRPLRPLREISTDLRKQNS